MDSASGTLAPSPGASTSTLNLANVLYETKGAIAYVTVNRPKVLNALNTPTWTDLRRAFEQIRDDVDDPRRDSDWRRRQGVYRRRRHQRARASHGV